MCTHDLRNYGLTQILLALRICFVLLQHCSHSIIQNLTECFGDIVPILSFKTLQNVLPAVLSSVIPPLLPGPALSPFSTKVYHYSFSPPLTRILVLPYLIIQHNHHGKQTFSPVLHKIIHYFICPCFLSIIQFSYTLLYFFSCELFL